MRLILDTLVALVLVAVLATLVWQWRAERVRFDQLEQVRQAIQAIESHALYRAAVGDVEATPLGYSRRIEAAWFEPRPENSLLKDAPHRWLDRAADDEFDRFNPAHIVAGGPRAAFWYNPGRGIVRARVPMQLSHRATADLYNLVNSTALTVRDAEWPPSDAQPQPAATDEPDKKQIILRDRRRQ